MFSGESLATSKNVETILMVTASHQGSAECCEDSGLSGWSSWAWFLLAEGFAAESGERVRSRGHQVGGLAGFG